MLREASRHRPPGRRSESSLFPSKRLPVWLPVHRQHCPSVGRRLRIAQRFTGQRMHAPLCRSQRRQLGRGLDRRLTLLWRRVLRQLGGPQRGLSSGLGHGAAIGPYGRFFLALIASNLAVVAMACSTCSGVRPASICSNFGDGLPVGGGRFVWLPFNCRNSSAAASSL